MQINIYISSIIEDKTVDIRKKYHVSLSTISQILTDYFRPNITEEMMNQYIDHDKRNKTTIKPNNLTKDSEMMEKCKGQIKIASHVYSNIVYLFFSDKWQKLLNNPTEKQINKCKKEIEKEFFNKREIFWNYNANIRNQVRIIRKNSDYFRRILA